MQLNNDPSRLPDVALNEPQQPDVAWIKSMSRFWMWAGFLGCKSIDVRPDAGDLIITETVMRIRRFTSMNEKTGSVVMYAT